jgi:predicted transcriptional regulator of viral defense system
MNRCYNVTNYTQPLSVGAGVYMLDELKLKPTFTTFEAQEHGLSARMLTYYVKTGVLDRVARGVYRFSDYIPKDENVLWEDLAVAAQRVSNGVICLISALNYYGLTDERMREYWIAVPHAQAHSHFPLTRIVRLRNIELGVEKKVIAEIEVKIFNPERTIVDSFRLLDFETAIKALKLYLKGECGKPDLKKLSRYSKELRANIEKHIVPLIA